MNKYELIRQDNNIRQPLFLSYPVCITPYLRFESGPEESYEEKIAYL